MQYLTKHQAKGYQTLTLAFLGDSVFELLVRQKIILNGDMKIDRLHSIKVGIVCAKFQAKVMSQIMDTLSEEELAIFKRGRNSKCHTPKSADIIEYRMATGLECLFGYLYLIGDLERLNVLFSKIWDIYDKEGL